MKVERRDFLKLVGGGGLMLGLIGGCRTARVVGLGEVSEASFTPNVFLSITPEGRVVLALNKSEMGQGIATGSAVMVAEELEVPVSAIHAVHVARPEFETAGMQITGGSTSTAQNYLPMRRAAASAREMLIGAAAARWQVAPSTCRAEAGAVLGPGGQKLTYGELAQDAARQPMVEDPPLKAVADHRQIGKPVTRVDARAKVTGKAVFGADVSLPGMVRAKVLHPPQLGAPVASVDATAALQMAGVLDVFAFERGVAVVADKFWQASAAAAEVKVTWGEGPVDGLDSAAVSAASRARVRERGAMKVRDDGDVEAALRGGDDVVTVDVTYEAPYLAHAAMEPMTCTVWIKDDAVEVWAPNQSPSLMAEAVASTLGRNRADVRVETTMLGGGFGRKAIPDFAIEAAMIARRVGRPVQLIWTREDDMRAAYYRPAAVARMRGAVGKDGRVRALHYHGVSQSIFADISPFFGALYPNWMPKLAQRMMMRATGGVLASGSIPDVLATEGVSDTPYSIENCRVEWTPLRTGIPVSFWRSVGHSFNAFMSETFIDELAHAAHKDPYELRREHLASAPQHLRVLEAAAKLGRWGTPIEAGWGRGIAVHKSFGSVVAEVVEAGVFDGRIRVRRVACAVDCGLAVTPDIVVSQMESGIIYGLSAAIDQRLDIVDGVVQQGNFHDFPSLRMHESPEVVVEIIPSTEPPTGVGEPGLPPVLGALSNALFAATGVRLRSMPLQAAWDHRKEST